ncbi:MAG: transposase domain-containing protein [Pseudomonadales bacterium]|nr:transposase domain-containing protein [Pseudomonadales bacterium]
MVETAKENALDPAVYLAQLFRVLPNLPEHTDASLDALMPWNFNAGA